MKQRNGSLSFVIILAVVAFIAVGLILYYATNRPSGAPAAVTPVESAPTITNSSILGTSVFTDTQNGFTFTFPSSSKVETTDLTGNFLYATSSVTLVNVFPSSSFSPNILGFFSIARSDSSGNECIGMADYTVNKAGGYNETLRVGTTTQNISGVTFYAYEDYGIGLGSAYDQYFYHGATPHGCYEIYFELTYSDGGEISQTEVDDAANQMKAMVASVKFL